MNSLTCLQRGPLSRRAQHRGRIPWRATQRFTTSRVQLHKGLIPWRALTARDAGGRISAYSSPEAVRAFLTDQVFSEFGIPCWVLFGASREPFAKRLASSDRAACNLFRRQPRQQNSMRVVFAPVFIDVVCTAFSLRSSSEQAQGELSLRH